MASLTTDQISILWESGVSEKFGLYAVKQVNSGDTIDFAPLYRVVLNTAWMGATVSGTIAGTAQTGTTVTAPAGLTNAGAYLLVQGVAR